jgi:thioredoxin-like negative regulator of GroEL
MSNEELEKIRLRKAKMLLKLQFLPKDIINIKMEYESNNLLKNFLDKIITIDFWAERCDPCKLFAPFIVKVYQEYSIDFIFMKFNIYENPKIAQYFGIGSIPTTLFIKEGNIL